MDDKNFKIAQELVHPSYIRLAQNSINKREKIFKQLLSQRQLPSEGLDDLTIKYFLDTLALMDSNNFEGKVGVGERESRIFSNIVAERHFFMGHGIGRSGDIMANQPKAAGSSLILQLARCLTVSALHQLNYLFVKDVLPLPLATGMSLSLALLTLHELKPKANIVIWSRIDQKTCLKSILTANLTPVIIELQPEGDSLVTDLEAIEAKIMEVGPENVLAVMSTTSCFAPRVPDKIDSISILAKKYDVFHVVNNAYGIWCSKIAHMMGEGWKKGECTVVVQSTDKNFMVPVGGSFVFCQDSKLLEKISSKYPGRANGSPIVDLFITLLAMGKKTIHELKTERKNLFQYLLTAGRSFADKHGCKILSTPTNSISIAMHLGEGLKEEKDVTDLGAILYSKRVMGHRILAQSAKVTQIGENKFINYGSHCQKYEFLPYITFACAVGTKKEEIDLFFQRLEQSWKELDKKINKKIKFEKIIEGNLQEGEEKKTNESGVKNDKEEVKPRKQQVKKERKKKKQEQVEKKENKEALEQKNEGHVLIQSEREKVQSQKIEVQQSVDNPYNN